MNFFAGANSRNGFISIFDNVFKDTERLFILKGSSGCGKSTLMKKIAKKAEAEGIPVDYIYCSADVLSLDGVIFPTLSIGIVDGTSPHVMDVKYPCARESIINLGEFWKEDLIIPSRTKIMSLTDLKGCHYKNAYRALAAAGDVNELLSEIIGDCVDRKKLESFAFKAFEKACGEKGGKRKQIYASAFTAEGFKSVELFGNLQRVYYLNGKASHFLLNAIEGIAIELGAEFVYSHNPIDPKIADLIYFPKTEIAFTTINAPICHNSKETNCISTGRFLDKLGLSAVKHRIKGLERLKEEILMEAKTELSEAKKVHDEIESIYIPAMDFDAMNKFTEGLADRILNA